jgi:hypothetical protein
LAEIEKILYIYFTNNLNMKKIILFAVCIGFSYLLKSQSNTCNAMAIFKEGTKIGMSSYDDDGKPSGSSMTTYKEVKKLDGNTVQVTANMEGFNKKGKPTSNSSYTVKCQNGTLMIDLRSMVPDEQMKGYKDMKMEIEGVEKSIPYNIKSGDKLKDANMSLKFKTQSGESIPFGNMDINVTERMVEAKESITTPAGTFECYKISEKVEIKTIIGFKFKTTTWWNFEIGTVKSEQYKESGKYMGKTELSSYTKP